MWFTQDGLRTHINCESVIIIPSNKNKGIQPASHPLHFLFTLSQSLSYNHRDNFTMLQYNTRLFYNATIQYIAVLQCFYFIGELPWENTTGHPIPWAHKLLANKHPKKFLSGALPPNPCRGPSRGNGPLRTLAGGTMSPRTPLLGQVYNKTGVQTWLNNNISKSGRIASTNQQGIP